jgi:N-acetylneuraminate synthase
MSFSGSQGAAVPVEVVAEIGINHNGDLATACKLVEEAAWAGVDYVKFQKREPELCVPRDQWDIPKQTPWGEMSYIDYRRRMEFSAADYRHIVDAATVYSLPVFWSVWDEPSIEFVLQFSPPYIKIPSAKATDLDLIRQAAKTGLPVIVSTGMTKWSDISLAESVLRQNGNGEHMLMHAHSAYPAPLEELGLLLIPKLRDTFYCRIGYSGHTYAVRPTIWAAVLGAEMVEMHITLDHNRSGSPHWSRRSGEQRRRWATEKSEYGKANNRH